MHMFQPKGHACVRASWWSWQSSPQHCGKSVRARAPLRHVAGGSPTCRLNARFEIRFGARAVKGSDLVRDIKAIIATKIPLCAVAEDLADRGIQSSQLVPGIEQIQRSGIARLIEGNDRILSW